MFRRSSFLGVVAVVVPSAAAPSANAWAQSSSAQETVTVTVTASRLDMMGRAITASQGTVTKKELDLRPVYRVGQLLEAVPGLVVTVHSGEGKANQYLIRGYNLDHGTDIANFIDDMPVNRPTNAHGQGYSDLNFFMAPLFSGIDYTKGPYFASIGDFGAVASTHIRLLDELPNQIIASAGTLGDEDLFAGGTYHFTNGMRLIAAGELGHVDGGTTPPQNFRKIASTLRLSQGTDADGYSLTGMYYKGQGRNITDQPLRAIDGGVIDRFGTLDPTDGSQSERWSVSSHYGVTSEHWALSSSLYLIHSTMVLWNNFTHLLDDPLNGDQEQQDETRSTAGGQTNATYRRAFWNIRTETTLGLQDRFDDDYIDRRHTRDRVVLPYCNDGNGDYSIGVYACTADRVTLNDLGLYGQNTTRWLPWLRTVAGLREDYQTATDRSVLSTNPFLGSVHQPLFQPKGSIVIGPWRETELYYSAGKGFHSDDVRGVLQSVPLEGTQLNAGRAPLLASTFGQEIGLRNSSIPHLQLQAAIFRQDFTSEQQYDQDAGQDVAQAPSRREGVELSAQWRPRHWIELNGDVAFAKARYFENAATLASTYGIAGGAYIANAPNVTGSFGILVDDLGPWFGGVEQRILGSYPLTDGVKYPRGKGYSETNLDVGYKLTPKLKLQLSIYNLFNTHAASAEYYYATDINAAEVAKYGTSGVSDYQVHYLEPLSARLTLTAGF
ncbi:TonB-dependent receptor [Acetobacteraceae bacterium KSS8]|uniref:TonB-dependent receptor n=1 Tax=Endosaccharibacter trunci TaxID=2812733 RepID=A0ABT1WBS6_9PROT|nr:TonB-dependent receptor [Acetobacteraceae bacterium KSS8]